VAFWQRGNKRRDEIDAEIRSHLQMAAHDRVERGETSRQADQAARREFGNVGLVKEVTRDIWGWRWLQDFVQDLRFGVRMLRKSVGFTITVVLTLTLGIGANVAIFSVLYAVMLNPLPYRDPSRLVVINETDMRDESSDGSFSYPDFVDVAGQDHSFSGIGVERGTEATLTGGGRPRHLIGARISPDLLSILGVMPLLGTNSFPVARAGPSPEGLYQVILGHELWQSVFGSDPRIIGKLVSLDGEPYTVAGVMPRGFTFPIAADPVQYWVSVARDMRKTGADTPKSEERSDHEYYAVARLKPDVTLRRAQTELDTITARLRKQYPETNSYMALHGVVLIDYMARDAKATLLLLLAAAGFLLLMACANVANLLLARATTRSREIAIRSALGAGRMRIIRQLGTESIVFSLAGGALGVLLAQWGTPALLAWAPRDIPRMTEAGVNGSVLAFALIVSVTTGVAFGILPALQSVKSDVAETLKEAGRTSGPVARTNRTRAALMSLQVALAVVLLVGAGLLGRSLSRLGRVRLGFESAHVMTADISLPSAQYKTGPRAAFFNELQRRISAMPGVRRSSGGFPLPLSGSEWVVGFEIEGHPLPEQDRPAAVTGVCEPGYFATVGIPIVRGRDFTATDTPAATPVIIVSEALAAKIFPGQDPLGKRIKPSIGVTGVDPTMREIIGVVGDVHYSGLRDQPGMQAYEPESQLPLSELIVVVQTQGDPRAIGAAIRDQVNSLDSSLAVTKIEPMTLYVERALAEPRLDTFLLGTFAAIALALAAVGLFGVMAYIVAQRTHEIGIRMALGAQPADVLRLVLSHAFRMTFWGGAAGIAMALALARLMNSVLFGVSATDGVTFLWVSIVLAGVALAACSIPARRATRVAPLVALRYE
jgi:putative ABC transport system permease protein